MEDILKNESNGPEESPEGTPEIGAPATPAAPESADSGRKSEDEVVHHPRLLGL